MKKEGRKEGRGGGGLKRIGLRGGKSRGDTGKEKVVDNIWNKVISSNKTTPKNNTFLI